MLSHEELEAENRRKEELMKRWAQQPITFEEIKQQQLRNNKALGIEDPYLGMSFEQLCEIFRSSRKKNSGK